MPQAASSCAFEFALVHRTCRGIGPNACGTGTTWDVCVRLTRKARKFEKKKEEATVAHVLKCAGSSRLVAIAAQVLGKNCA